MPSHMRPDVLIVPHWRWRWRCYQLALLGVVSLCILHDGWEANGAPIPAPDLLSCQEDSSIPTKCCPSVVRNQRTKSFINPSSSSLPLRVRRPAHQLDAATVAKLERAYARMRALPATDPRSLEQQRRMHCAYCCALFPQPWTVTVPGGGQQIQAALQIHFGWLLMPWHRWFLYFHERILASLIGDNTLALPFWNWSNQQAAQDASGKPVSPGAMPPPYQVVGSPLYDSKRSLAHRPPAIANLSYNSDNRPTRAQINSQQLTQANLNMMHQVMVSAPSTRGIFFGQPYRLGGQVLPGGGPGQGVLESTVHNCVHDWTGDERNQDLEDMGAFYVSGIDPIFYAHHGEIDRLWNIYKARGGRDLNDTDFLDTEFVFYDETAQPVKVKVRQGLDTVNQLRYTYQPVVTADAQWLSYVATSCASPTGTSKREVTKYSEHQAQPLTITVATPLTVLLERPAGQRTRASPAAAASSSSDGGSDGTAQVLVLDGIKVDWKRSAQLKVFVNLPDVSAATSTACAEFLGLFSNVPNKVAAGRDKVAFKLGLDNKLQQLGLEEVLEVVVSLVPGEQHTSSSPVFVDRISISVENV